jgi:hypothetical protein
MAEQIVSSRIGFFKSLSNASQTLQLCGLRSSPKQLPRLRALTEKIETRCPQAKTEIFLGPACEPSNLFGGSSLVVFYVRHLKISLVNPRVVYALQPCLSGHTPSLAKPAKTTLRKLRFIARGRTPGV